MRLCHQESVDEKFNLLERRVDGAKVDL
eukprot:COSAG05_NODE_471_length_9498_cov_2.811895_3_plen_27_part_01